MPSTTKGNNMSSVDKYVPDRPFGAAQEKPVEPVQTESMADIVQLAIDGAYRAGFEDGLESYAINKSGIQMLGCNTKLARAIEKIEQTWNWCRKKPVISNFIKK